jgi:hypothetical protein
LKFITLAQNLLWRSLFQKRENVMSWAKEEFAQADLGDKRLNKRLIKLVEQFADKPTASIPGACGGWAET